MAGKHGRGLMPGTLWLGIFALVALTVLVILTVSGLLVVSAELKQARSELNHQQRDLGQLRSENRNLSAEIKHLKETSQTLGEIKDRVFEINRRRVSMVKWAALPDRGGNWINRIDQYLAKTPLRGRGRNFYLAAVDAGIEPRLMPAIAVIESGGGRVNANTNNFFGRRAVRGWMAWPTPEAAIDNQAKYISRMWGRAANPYQMRGYAVPGASWMRKVAGEMARI